MLVSRKNWVKTYERNIYSATQLLLYFQIVARKEQIIPSKNSGVGREASRYLPDKPIPNPPPPPTSHIPPQCAAFGGNI
jgi:hypothetical protein